MSHRDDAEALNEALKLIAGAVPGLAALPKRVLAGLIRYASVPDSCIHETIVLVRDMPGVAEAARLDADYAVDTMEFSAAYGSVADTLEGLARGVRVAVLQRRAEVGRSVLTAIAMAKRMKIDVKAAQKALARKQRRFPKKRRRKKT
jgi:hypothetical protein